MALGRGWAEGMLLLALCAPAGAAQGPAAPPPASPVLADSIERHPLESRALHEPEAVRVELEAALRAAQLADDEHLVALLQLARANACRVVADWDCQREAGLAAQAAARRAGAVHLQVRGLINEGRARIAMQDYTRGERLFGEAELLLRDAPQAELLADVYLAYSSMSYSLGKHKLAADYARQGLALLREGEALVIHSRLHRNLARALAHLGRLDEAAVALAEATRLATEVDDPKLEAELYLEAARIARVAGDVPTQVENGERVLAMAQRLRNSQLSGLGHEVLGLAAADAVDGRRALAEFNQAIVEFRSLELASDERRVLRELIGYLLRHQRGDPSLPALFERFLALDAQLTQSERTQAADDFDARLKYAERESELARLQVESELARERERALAETNRLNQALMLLGLATLGVLATFFLLQRRGNRRLREVLARLGERELQYRTLAENASDLVVRMRPDGERIYVSPSIRDLLGYEPADFMRPRWDLVHPEDRERVRASMEGLVARGGALTVSYRLQHQAGHYVWIEALARSVPTPGGGTEIVYAGRDISVRMRTEQALAAIQARLHAVADNIPAMIAHVDRQERYTFANALSQRVLRIGGAGEIVGRTVRDVRGEAVYRDIKPHVDAALRGERVTFEGEADVDGRHYHYQTSYVPDLGPDGEVQGFYSFIFDITRLKAAERDLARLAREDVLTGLANRLSFDERLPPAVARVQRSGAGLALLYLDVDHFKAINDGLGHAAGDEVLRVFAARLRGCLRAGDVAARLGGDEFAVLVEGADSAQAAEAIAAKLLRVMEEPVPLPGGPHPVGVSIGIAFAGHGAAPDRLLAAADQALYAAKAAGRRTWRALEID